MVCFDFSISKCSHERKHEESFSSFQDEDRILLRGKTMEGVGTVWEHRIFWSNLAAFEKKNKTQKLFGGKVIAALSYRECKI